MKAVMLCAAVTFVASSSLRADELPQPKAERTEAALHRDGEESQSAENQFRAGKALWKGWGQSSPDDAEAAKWFRKAAERGHAEAQYYLGFCYSSGRGVPKDDAEASKWFDKAAQHQVNEGGGDSDKSRAESAPSRDGAERPQKAEELFQTGKALWHDGDSSNDVEAVKWLRKAAELGHAEAQYYLGNCYARGEGVSQDEEEAFKWLEKAAEQGVKRAQLMVGLKYMTGHGMRKDATRAVPWFQAAADQGDADAQFYLSMCYSGGEGVEKDDLKAVQWLRSAAEKGQPEAQSRLASRLFKGIGVEKDYVQAAVWFRRAADQGDADAQFSFGVCYDVGAGVPKSKEEAARWYLQAADAGHAMAQLYLGNSYCNGEGVPKDDEAAVRWWRRAAERGVVDAQCKLGASYSTGSGVPKDLVQAHCWLNLSAAKGNALGKQMLALAESAMTREQIAEAEKLAREFRPQAPPTAERGSAAPLAEVPRPVSSGTGFFITKDGYLVTNQHVVAGKSLVRVLTPKGELRARLVRADAANDLALLKVEGAFACLPVASSKGVRLGSTVVTVGFPNTVMMGYSPKLSKGEVASLAGLQDDPAKFQVSVALQPGNSGGALLDERGNVIGVVASKLDVRAAVALTGAIPENVNYAIKSSYLLGFLESVPEVAGKLSTPHADSQDYDAVVESAQKATALVQVY